MRSGTIKGAAREAARGVAERAAEQPQVDQLRERLTPVVEHAISLAREQAGQAALAAGHAREWAAPMVEAAVEKGRQAAGPRVEAAAERVAPAMDATRDRIVEDLMPRLLDAVQHAVVAGVAAKAAATDTVSRTVEDAALSLAASTPSAKARVRRRRRRARSFCAALAAFFVSVGIMAAIRRAKAQQASWEYAPTGVPSSTPSGVNGAPREPVMDVVTPADTPEPAIPAPTPGELFTPNETSGTSTPADKRKAANKPGTRQKAPKPSETGKGEPDMSTKDAPFGPETIGIDTRAASDTPSRPRDEQP